MLDRIVQSAKAPRSDNSKRNRRAQRPMRRRAHKMHAAGKSWAEIAQRHLAPRVERGHVDQQAPRVRPFLTVPDAPG